jgi:hypothetical protein
LLEQNLLCASDSYKLQVRSKVAATGTRFAGKWNEVTRDAIGNISGTITGTGIRGKIDGVGFHRGSGDIDPGQPPIGHDRPHRSNRHFAGRDHIDANLASASTSASASDLTSRMNSEAWSYPRC